jgi:hypothetical protein
VTASYLLRTQLNFLCLRHNPLSVLQIVKTLPPCILLVFRQGCGAQLAAHERARHKKMPEYYSSASLLPSLEAYRSPTLQ